MFLSMTVKVYTGNDVYGCNTIHSMAVYTPYSKMATFTSWQLALNAVITLRAFFSYDCFSVGHGIYITFDLLSFACPSQTIAKSIQLSTNQRSLTRFLRNLHYQYAVFGAELEDLSTAKHSKQRGERRNNCICRLGSNYHKYKKKVVQSDLC